MLISWPSYYDGLGGYGLLVPAQLNAHPPLGTYKVYIDWNKDGDFSDSGEDVTAGEGVKSISYSRGFDKQSGKALVGKCTIRLNNNLGTYNPLLHPEILPDCPIKIVEAHTEITLFTGTLEDIKPYRYLTHQECSMAAVDGLPLLSRANGLLEFGSYSLDNAIELLLDGAGWPAALREFRGTIDLADWLYCAFATGEQGCKDEMERLAGGIGGRVYLDGENCVISEDMQYRKDYKYIAAYIFDDEMISIAYSNNTKNLYNDIKVTHIGTTVQYGPAAAWQYSDDVSIADGETYTYKVRLDNIYDIQLADITLDWDWDGAAGSGVSTAVRCYGTYTEIDVTPSGGDIIVHSVDVDGRLIDIFYKDSTAEDSFSIDKHDRRVYKIDSQTFDTQGPPLATNFLERYKRPTHELTIQVINSSVAIYEQILSLTIGERVAVIDAEFGIDGDYFIEEMKHDITEGGLVHKVTYRLSHINEIFNTSAFFGWRLCLTGQDGSGTTLTDEGQYGTDATISGASWVQNLAGLWYLDLDGDSDTVTCSLANVKDVYPIVILFWCYPRGDTIENWPQWVSCGGWAAGGWAIGAASAINRTDVVKVLFGSAVGWLGASSTVSLNLNEWNFVAIRISGATNPVVEVIVNDASPVTDVITGPVVACTAANLNLPSATPNGAGPTLLRIIAGELSDDQLQSIRRQEKGLFPGL